MNPFATRAYFLAHVAFLSILRKDPTLTGKLNPMEAVNTSRRVKVKTSDAALDDLARANVAMAVR